MEKSHYIRKGIVKKNQYKIIFDIFIIILFLLVSYFIINSKYNFEGGDAGAWAHITKQFVEKHELSLKKSQALGLGQMFFGYIFSIVFGYSLKTLHISSYFAAFLVMISFYLFTQIVLEVLPDH